MPKKSLSYADKSNAIKNYTSLGIKNRKNFNRKEKWLISRYFNISKKKGYFEYNQSTNEFIEKVKFVKSKSKKQKGAPKFKGYFVQGASPSDKIRKGKIIKENYIKTFIPMDFSDLPPQNDDNEFEDYIYQIVFDALTPYFEDIKPNDYFTIVLQNGWELGQRKNKEYIKTHKGTKDGQKIAEDLSGDKKFENLADKIIELLAYAKNKYDLGSMALVSGVFLWQFINQRKPTNKEKKVIRKRKRK